MSARPVRPQPPEVAEILRFLRERAQELRVRASSPDSSAEWRKAVSKMAEEVGRLANEIERGDYLA